MLTGWENGSQKGITGQKFGSQNYLPDENLAMTWQKCIFLFSIASCQIFHIWHIDQGGKGHLLSQYKFLADSPVKSKDEAIFMFLKSILVNEATKIGIFFPISVYNKSRVLPESTDLCSQEGKVVFRPWRSHFAIILKDY